MGKEGPMVHTGACIASLLGQGGSRKYRLTWKWLRYFKNDRDRRDLITCGAGAGVAAAFRAPVGGVLFALEEAASWSLSLSLSLYSTKIFIFGSLVFSQHLGGVNEKLLDAVIVEMLSWDFPLWLLIF